jgi:S1 RNA binding domain protein
MQSVFFALFCKGAEYSGGILIFPVKSRIINLYLCLFYLRKAPGSLTLGRMSFFFMALEVGNIVEGTVTGIAKFGAFVELPDKSVGLVHISEVASEYVNDVNDYLKVQDKIKVKVITIDDKGKIALSIKQAQPAAPQEKRQDHFHRDHEHGNGREFHHFTRRENSGDREASAPAPRNQERRSFSGGYRQSARQEAPASFEDKLSRFLKDSDERLLDLKRNVESKRGGRGARRSD